MYVLDIEHRGYLLREAFINGLQRMSPKMTKEEAIKEFDHFDQNGLGYLEFDDFVINYVQDKDIMENTNCGMIFKTILYDHHNSQKKSSNEIQLDDLRAVLNMKDSKFDEVFGFNKGTVMVNEK